MAAKAFCVLVFVVLCCAVLCGSLAHSVHPALLRRPISDKDAKLYHCGYVGMRSFTLHTSSLCLQSWLHRDAPERACPSRWEHIENMISASITLKVVLVTLNLSTNSLMGPLFLTFVILRLIYICKNEGK